jgi:hypothetical protein
LRDYYACTFSTNAWSHKAAKQRAAEDGISISVYLRQLIRRDYEAHQRERQQQKAIDRLVDHLAMQEVA